MRHSQTAVIASGLILLVGGAWLLAPSVGFPTARFENIWPAALVLLGVVMLVYAGANRGRSGGLVFAGFISLLSGIYFLVFTLRMWQLTWASVAVYWPLLFLIVAASLLAVYLAQDMAHPALLSTLSLIGAIGLVALPVTTGAVTTPAFRQAISLWPLLVFVLVVAFFRSRVNRPDDHSDL